MSRHSAPLVATALCLMLLCATLPRTQASAAAAPPKEAKETESCATCPSGSPGKKNEWVNKLATAGRRTQQSPFAPVHRSIFDGARINLVGTANGSLAFTVTDLKLSGLMPLAFVRIYASDRAEDRGLGAGWSFAYDDRIKIEGDDALMTTGAGDELAFRRDGRGRRFVLRSPQPGLHQSFAEAAGGTLSESVGGLTRTYRQVGSEYRLARIADRNGNAIAISFDRRGNVSRVETVGGRALTMEWSAGERPRLLAVSDNTGRRVSFVSRDGQQLAAFVDQAGGQWKYRYEGGRLTQATDPVGRVVLRVRYDSEGRAVESGDAAGSHRFEYEGGGRTAVTDPLGAKTSFTHTALGAISSLTNVEGVTTTVEYDESNRPVRATVSSGKQQTLTPEAEGSGAAHTYDARGNVLSARSGDPSTSYRAARNSRGQAVSLRAESGREITFEYNAAGDETALTYSDLGRFEKRFDAAGRVTARRLPSGRSFTYQYDARGELARASDSSGRALTVERDAGGMISRVAAGGGRWVRVSRDAAGRVTRLDSADGKSRQFAYDARGALTYYRDARGRRYGMSYDRAGRLERLENSDGVTVHYRYGSDGRVAAVSRGGRASFAKAGFIFSPAARDNEYDPLQCMLVEDGFGWYYDPCDPAATYSNTDAVVTAWEYARTGGSVPIHNPENSPTECIRRELGACEAARQTCMFYAGLAVAAIVPCIVLMASLCIVIYGRRYWDTAWQCDSQAEACRLAALNKCPQT